MTSLEVNNLLLLVLCKFSFIWHVQLRQSYCKSQKMSSLGYEPRRHICHTASSERKYVNSAVTSFINNFLAAPRIFPLWHHLQIFVNEAECIRLYLLPLLCLSILLSYFNSHSSLGKMLFQVLTITFILCMSSTHGVDVMTFNNNNIENRNLANVYIFIEFRIIS